MRPYLISNDVVEAMGWYMYRHYSTIREVAKEFRVKKSTAYHCLTKRLKYINSPLYVQVKGVLKLNLEKRAIRGGMANKHRWTLIKLDKDLQRLERERQESMKLD